MVMPGVRSSMTHGSRAEGMFCIVSRSNVDFVPVSRVSTSGLAPVTVTVSCTVESSRAPLTWARKPMVTRMSCITMVRKPGQFERHRVGADRQLRHAIGAGFRGHGHARLNQRGTGDRDGRARQHGARLVGRPSEDFTGLLLCQRGRCAKNEHQRRRDKRLSQRHFPSSKSQGNPSEGHLQRPSRHYRSFGPTTEVHVPKSSNCATGHQGCLGDAIRPKITKMRDKRGTNCSADSKILDRKVQTS